jgi:hypothetical protein
MPTWISITTAAHFIICRRSAPARWSIALLPLRPPLFFVLMLLMLLGPVAPSRGPRVSLAPIAAVLFSPAAPPPAAVAPHNRRPVPLPAATAVLIFTNISPPLPLRASRPQVQGPWGIAPRVKVTDGLRCPPSRCTSTPAPATAAGPVCHPWDPLLRSTASAYRHPSRGKRRGLLQGPAREPRGFPAFGSAPRHAGFRPAACRALDPAWPVPTSTAITRAAPHVNHDLLPSQRRCPTSATAPSTSTTSRSDRLPFHELDRNRYSSRPQVSTEAPPLRLLRRPFRAHRSHPSLPTSSFAWCCTR